jgi:hypothetical protein
MNRLETVAVQITLLRLAEAYEAGDQTRADLTEAADLIGRVPALVIAAGALADIVRTVGAGQYVSRVRCADTLKGWEACFADD